jgi:2,4-dienoyl-CoA reductase-like NADH-dependent reductase (Old Yellow Enzyme family)
MIIPTQGRQELGNMSMLFTPGNIGNLTVSNRMVRSATAERLADADGWPKPRLQQFYQELVRGGVGLIITGDMYVHPSGCSRPEMTGIYSDEMIPALAELADAVHREGGRVVAQISHGGMHCTRQTVPATIAPSAIDAPFLEQPAREMTSDEITLMIQAYGQAAWRAQEAGFDGVQFHGAHGYLISQFLSPFANRRTDEWGGDLEGRMRFLRAICQATRERVGPDYPVFIKLGMVDGVEGGLTLEEAVQVVAALEEMGLNAVEISSGIEGGRNLNSLIGIRCEADEAHFRVDLTRLPIPRYRGLRCEAGEAYFRPLAQAARPVTRLPIILGGGMRSRRVMEDVLAAGDADFVSLCRPLICEPDLPDRLRSGLQERSACISANRCVPKGPDEGISCKCPIERDHPGEPTT